MTICKVQRPLGGNDASMPWMIYSRGREWISQVPDADVTDSLRAMMGDRAKIYVEASVRKNGRVEIIRRVPDQDW